MSRRSKTYLSTTHPDIDGSGWWGAPWGHNLPEITERVPGHGCATCCSALNRCEQCTVAVEAATKGEDDFATGFCRHHWLHFQVEEGCQCGRCRTDRDQNGPRQAEDIDLDPMRRYVASAERLAERLAELPRSELNAQRVAEIANSMRLATNSSPSEAGKLEALVASPPKDAA